jgi:hypothetical protein
MSGTPPQRNERWKRYRSLSHPGLVKLESLSESSAQPLPTVYLLGGKFYPSPEELAAELDNKKYE